MSNIKVLDCTLRDGGYINNWDFGKSNISYIINGLYEAEIDIIEVGFLSNKTNYTENSSKFSDFSQMDAFISDKKNGSMFVCMINFGEYKIEDIPNNEDTLLDGIRLAFHKKDLDEALLFASNLVSKGYKVFIQAMVAANYSDNEYLDLIKKSNEINPYAFYIVDSFGVMNKQDVIRYFYMLDYNLDKNIIGGFHSHNNLQLSYSNAQALLQVDTNRDIIIDSSVFGMGRGAGNLNTELFIDYLNNLQLGNYKTEPLLNIIDYVLKPIYEDNYWGYSLPHYLSAKTNCHPNYATYLDDKGTLTVKAISDILKTLDDSKKFNFDRNHIRELYHDFQRKLEDVESDILNLKELFENQEVLLIAPGLSIAEENEKVETAIKDKNIQTIAVNFEPNNLTTDYIFFSNLRRFEKSRISNGEKVITTSNIPSEKAIDYNVIYSKYTNDYDGVEDNAGLMLIKLLIECNVNKIYLAGFDGYSLNRELNFSDKSMSIVQTKERLIKINKGMNNALKEFKKQINVEFLTTPRNISL